MTQLHIRRAVPNDLETIVAHNRAMASETEDKNLDEAVVRRGTAKALADPARAFYLIAERDSRAVGQLMITSEWSDWRDGAFWWIQSVYVQPESRRQGVFRALYHRVRDEADQVGDVCGLRLYVDRDNRNARGTYEALGMRLSHYDLFEIDYVLGAEHA